jgi:DNA repair protein RecO (recombination protein O)
VVAKGVRRTSSRLSGHVQRFTQARLLIAKGRNLDIITQSEPVKFFRTLTDDLTLFAHASYAAELLDRLTEDHSENFPAYQLLSETFEALNAGADPAVTIRAYELHILSYMGYRPQLQECVRCAAVLQPIVNYFSPEMGGVLCYNCGQLERRSVELSVDALKVLRYLQRTIFGTGPKLRLSDQLRRELEQVMSSYTRYLLERDLKSAVFIHTLP